MVAALPVQGSTADFAVRRGPRTRRGRDFAAEAVPTRLTRAVKEDLGPPAWLAPWLRGVRERREERRIRTARPRSGLPTGPTRAHVDFACPPAVERSQRETLATCAGRREKPGRLIRGPPGVGKTPRAIRGRSSRLRDWEANRKGRS